MLDGAPPSADDASGAWCGSLVVDWVGEAGVHDSKTLKMHLDAQVARCMQSRPRKGAFGHGKKKSELPSCAYDDFLPLPSLLAPAEQEHQRGATPQRTKATPAKSSRSRSKKALLKCAESEVHFGICEVGSFEERKVRKRVLTAGKKGIRITRACAAVSHT